MNKQEFLNKLRAALNGRVPTSVVTENVNYYEDYINTQVRMGRTEEEVLKALGDPRLLARTIIETNRSNGYREENGGPGQSYSGYNETGYQDAERDGYGKARRVPGWLWVIIVVLVVVVIMGVVLSVISFLAPFLLAILVVMFLVKLFRDWLN